MAVDKIVEELNKLSVLELVELKKALEEEWDVTAAAAAPVMVAAGAPAAGGGEGGGGEEEKDSFDVVLTADQIRELGDLPPRTTLLSQVVGAVNGPVQGTVGVLNAPLRDIVALLDAYIEKREAAEAA